MTPQVSVAIKSYNHAAFVGQTVQSVLDQSFQDFEIVVTDDGSSDGTPDVVRRFSDPRIHLRVLESNRGISVAMNETVARVRGEFVALLNSDDFALPGRLARQVEYLRSNPNVAAVFGLPRFVDELGQPTKGYFDFTRPFSLSDRSRQSLLNYFFFHGNLLCAPTAMIRHSVLAKVGDYDPRLSNLPDLDLWVRLCTNHDIHIMREELTAFRIRAGSRNMSAPRRDARLRTQFEFSQILRHYRSMDPSFLRQIFAGDLDRTGVSPNGAHEFWLAELALTTANPAHRLFALQAMFETARSNAEFRRLRDLLGTVDLFGGTPITERVKRIGPLLKKRLAR